MGGPGDQAPVNSHLEGEGIDEIKNITTKIQGQIDIIKGVLEKGVGTYTPEQMHMIRALTGPMKQSLTHLAQQLQKHL